MGQVSGKIALVTGAGSGIGAACAETLAREGARVVLSDLDGAAAGIVADRINSGGGQAVAFQQDVTDEARWPVIIKEIETTFGPLTTLVANAGIAMGGSIFEMSLADWRRQMAVNVDAVFLSVKYGGPSMVRAGGGSIVIMSSIAGLRGASGLAAYSASKGAVRLFAKSAAMEFAGANLNIRANSVHPGIIDTAIWGKMDSTRRNAPADIHAMAQVGVPLARVGLAQDIANGVLYLASDASSYVTGSELIIDGGMMGGGVRRG